MSVESEQRRERQLRHKAGRLGLMVVKSKCRNERAAEYGGYMLVDPATNGVVAGGHPWAFSLNLDDLAESVAE